MKRKLLKLTFALFATMVCSSVNATVYNGNCGTTGHESEVTWSYDDETTTMTISGTGAMADYTDALTDAPWNSYRASIVMVNIESGVTHVGNWAFQGCTNLTSVVIGRDVTSIGAEAFANCTGAGFTSLNIPNSVESIGAFAFSNNHLVAVCLGSGLSFIGNDAFSGCNDLIAIGCYAAAPPTLGSDVFETGTITDVYVASAKIDTYKAATGWSAFGTKIKSPGGDCGTSATWSFEMATHTLTISGTGDIESSPWFTPGSGCAAYNPNNESGYPCGIERVVIGEGITGIASDAFYMEVGITDVSLPSTLSSITTDAFGECENLTRLTCNAVAPPTLAAGYEEYVFYMWNADFSSIIPITTLQNIYVPVASIDAYKAATGWSDYAAYFQMSNTTIGGTHWATFFDATNNYSVDANTTVYKATLTGTTVALTEIGGNQIITANNAVILKSTGIPVLTSTATASTGDFTGNELHGSDGSAVSDGTYYALAYQNSVLGFYKVSSGTTIPAGKAYLKSADGARGFYGIDDDGTTAIKNMKVGKEDNIYYDLQGRRVLYPKKGLYILNGRKVIIK